MVKPVAKRLIVDYLTQHFQLSERVACILAGISRTAYHYRRKVKPDNVAKEQLKSLASRYPIYGYLMFHGLLKAQGLLAKDGNEKRVYVVTIEPELEDAQIHSRWPRIVQKGERSRISQFDVN